MARHIKLGDSVIVTAGNDKGTVGEVISVNPKHDTCIVKGVNVRTKHMKPTQQNQQGGIIKTEMPVHISNVSPCVDGKPSRVRFEVGEDGSKRRIAARDGSELHVLRGAGSSKN
ncbi:MAG: 50S ribosomal protein L24 [Planctomycetota bacterium]|nr:50S ribosomal protein L24 [Planctomycetota bacterium]